MLLFVLAVLLADPHGEKGHVEEKEAEDADPDRVLNVDDLENSRHHLESANNIKALLQVHTEQELVYDSSLLHGLHVLS